MKFSFIIFTILMLSNASRAAENSVQISGFGTLGMVTVDSDIYGYRKDLTQKNGTFDGEFDVTNTSILGIQFDYSINSTLDFVSQFIYHDQDDLTLDTATKLAFLRYTSPSGWNFRIGRTALDLFLLTEYRDVGFAYVWAHTPSEVYGLVPYRFIDGVDISYTKKISDVDFRTKLYYGQSKANIASYKWAEQVDIDNTLGLTTSLESYNWSIQARFTRTKLVNDPPSANELNNGLIFMAQNVPNFNFIWPNAESFAQSLFIKNTDVDYFSLGGRYDFDHWTVMAEFSLINSNVIVVPKLKAGYTSIIYHIDEHSFYGTYAATSSQAFDLASQNISLDALAMIPGGLDVYYGTESNLNFYASNQSTVSLGWRWNFSENYALKVQWDHTDIKRDGGAIWLNKSFISRPEDTVNSLFINLSFIF